MKATLIILEYFEYLIPITFLFFTHFVDEKIHKHWQNANYHPVKWIRLIHRYQWEICFLVISLFALLGIKLTHYESYRDVGLLLVIMSLIFLIVLFFIAMQILSREEQKMNANAMYLGLVVYILYLCCDIYFLKLEKIQSISIVNLSIRKEYLFLVGLIVFLISFYILKTKINRHLFFPVLKDKDVQANILLYKNEKTTRVKKAEALFFILKYFKETQDFSKLNEWLSIGQKDFPAKTMRLREYLQL